MTIKTVRTLHSTITNKLQSHEGFMYAHLVKFEKPIKTVTGAVAETARDYSYLTDASHNISFDDGSSDSTGNANGTQTYVAERLLKVGQVSETTQAKATSMGLTIDSIALNTVLSPASTTIDISGLTITIGESWIDAGFTEGDKLRISSNDGNNGKFIIINNFQNENEKIGIVAEAGAVAATNNTSYTFTIETEEHSSPFMDKEDSSYAHYINREVFVYKALIDPNTGEVVGPVSPSSGVYVPGPFLIFKGIIASVKVKEDPNKSSDVIWNLTSHWGDFVSINGRLTSDTEHRGINGQGESDYAALIRPEYVNDFGFMHSEQAINLISTYKATEKYYKFKKTGFLGLGSGKTEEKTRLVDREIELRFNLDSRRLPVVYGVNRIDSFPIFVDLGRTDTADVYAAYALCEGEIGGLYDIYLDDKSRICADETDNGARSSGSEAVSVVCEGRKDRGDTLKSKLFSNLNSSAGTIYAGPFGTVNIPVMNRRGGGRGQYTWNEDTGFTLVADYADSDVDPSTGIPHEEGHNFNSPINGRIIFHRGKPDQQANNMLVRKASEAGGTGGFMLQHQYFEDDDKSNYWGPNHRLLDTAYIVANYEITEEDLEIPELDFVVRGRILPCYDYDFSYRKDLKQTSAAATAFQLGQSVSLHKTSNDAQLDASITIADFYTYIDEDGEEHQKWRFASEPTLGTTTAFYMKTGTDKWYFTTYDHNLISSTINTDLRVGISSFANNSSLGVDITLADESGHGAFISKVIDYVEEVAVIPVSGTATEASAKLHFSSWPVDSVNTTTRVLQGVSNQTDGWATSSYDTVRVPKTFIIPSGNTTEDYYKGYSVTLTRTKADGTKVTQERKITKNKVIDSKVVAFVDADWEVDGSTDFTLEPKTFTGVTGRSADTFEVNVVGDTRISINPTLQLLDYITNKRYGKGLDQEKDIDLASFKTVARLCDTRSDITVIFPSGTSFAEGDVYKRAYNSNTMWQGTVREVSTKAYGGTNYTQVVFTDCIGKLAHRWFDWKVYNTGEIVYHHKRGRALVHTASSGTISEPTSGFSANTDISLTKVSGAGGSTASPNIWLGIFSGNDAADAGSVSYEGNPVIKQSGNTGFTDNGYSLYDSDDVKYWRYLGWQSQNQREVTRHQACPVIDTNVSVFENLNSLLAHFNGILRYSNGKYELDIQAAATLDGYGATDARIIRESDIVGTISVEDNGQKQSKNTVSVSFPDPQQEYGDREVTYFDSNYLAEDRNIPKKEDIKTPWVLNYYNTRINAKQYLEQSRYGKKINFVMEPKGNLLLAGTIIQVSYPRFGWGSDDFLVQQYLNQTTTTYEPHGFKVGDIVRYEDITNDTENVDSNYNDNYFTITGVTSTTFTTDQDTTDGTTISTNCGKVYKKGEYFRISNLNFREDCSVQVTAIEHNDKSYLISKRKSDVIGAVQPGTGTPAKPGAPSNVATETVDESKAIKVRWTNNAEAYKTTAGVTTWRSNFSTEIWINNQSSFTATDNSSFNQKFANGAILLARFDSDIKDHTYIPEGPGTQTRYHWVRHTKKVRPVGGKYSDQIELASNYAPLSSASGVSGSAQGSVAPKSVEIVATNGVIITYQGTERVRPTGNLAVKVVPKNLDTSKKWYYRYYTNIDEDNNANTTHYLLSNTSASGSNTTDNHYKGVHHWDGSENDPIQNTFSLHSNFEPKSSADTTSNRKGDDVTLHVEVFELDNTNGITSSDTPVATANIQFSQVNIARPNYEVNWTQETHTFFANSNGTADVTGFATTPTIYRSDDSGRVALTYEKYSSTAGANTFSYGDNTNEDTDQVADTEDGVTGTNCNPTVNTSTGSITLNSSDSGGIASGALTENTAKIVIQIKDNKAIQNGLRTVESDIIHKTVNLFKVPNPVREGTTIVVDVGDSNSDVIDSAFYTDFIAAGNLTTQHAQDAAAYIISKTVDGFIRPNDILTVTNGTTAASGSRIFTGSGTSSSGSVGAGNWSSKVVEIFDGSVIVEGTLSAETLAADTTFTRSLKVGSDLMVGSTAADGSTMAGQINTPTKTSYGDTDNGFYLDHSGKLDIGNASNYLRYDGSGNFSVAGSLNIAGDTGPAGDHGASTAVVFIRSSSTPTAPGNSYISATAAAAATSWYTTIPSGSDQLWSVTGTRAAHSTAAASSTYIIWGTPVHHEGADSTVPGPGGPSGPGMFRIDSGNTDTPDEHDITATLIDGAINRTFCVEGDICLVVNGATPKASKGFVCNATKTATEYAALQSAGDLDDVWDPVAAYISGDLVVDGGITSQKLSIISTGNTDSGIFASGTGGNSKIEVKEYTSGSAKTRVVIGYLG